MELPQEVVLLLTVDTDQVGTSACTIVVGIIPCDSVSLFLKLYLNIKNNYTNTTHVTSGKIKLSGSVLYVTC